MGGRLTVIWGIDGLEDTNHLYRVNVDWNRLQENWRAYISGGGKAKWQFIVFKWNQHQLDEVKRYSESEKFKGFNIIRSVRNSSDTNNNDKNITNIEIPENYRRNTRIL